MSVTHVRLFQYVLLWNGVSESKLKKNGLAGAEPRVNKRLNVSRYLRAIQGVREKYVTIMKCVL